MKLSSNPHRNATICAWNPASFDDQAASRLRYQPPVPGNENLADSLFAPAISDEFTSRDGTAARFVTAG